MDAADHSILRTRKPRGQGASRRGEILAAAKALFVEHGVDHVTMRRIATAVGVSATALYVYFPDKDAILHAIAAESFTALIAAHEASRRADRSAAENLRAGLQAYVAFALAHPDEYRLIFLRPSRQGGLDPCKDVPEAEIGFGLLVASVQETLDEGDFAAHPAMLIAEAVWACLHGLVSLLLVHPEAVESDTAALTGLVIDLAIRGLRSS